MSNPRVVIVGSGLAGLSAACELLERGLNVTILDKKDNFGGNSSKATCGIAAPGCSLQEAAGVKDDASDLISDSEAAAALVKTGAQDFEWLTKACGQVNELVLRLTPGHGQTVRTVGTKTHFPGAVITYAAIHVLQQIAAVNPDRLELINSAEVTKLVQEGKKVVGVEYKKADGTTATRRGSVLLATGGYAGDNSPDSILAKNNPKMASLPTTNDERANGDGIKLAKAVGAGTENLDAVQAIPTAAVLPGQEDSAFKVVVSDAICGAGGRLLDANGDRFVDELKSGNERCEAMGSAQGPFRLIIGEEKAKEVQWLVDFYSSRKILQCTTINALATQMGIPIVKVQQSLDVKTGKVYVAQVTPAAYSCCGGLQTGWKEGSEGRVLTTSGSPIAGLYAAGEVTAAPYQKIWSVSGIPLLHCIFSGRMAARAAAADALEGKDVPIQEMRDLIISSLTANAKASKSGPGNEEPVEEKKLEDMSKEELLAKVKELQAGGAVVAAAAPAAPAAAPGITMEEVAKHNKKDDAWIILFGEALDVTKWIPIHPGGEQAICAYLGQDATDEWQMIHKPGTVEKNLAHVTKMGKVGAGGGGGAAAAAPADAGGISMDEVAKHNTKEDAWIILFGEAIDVTKWIPIHPGGEAAIMAYVGKDATDEWKMIHKPGTVEKNMAHITKKGKVSGAVQTAQATASGPEEAPCPEGDGGIPGIVGAVIFSLLNFVRLIIPGRIFFTNNIKLDNNRTGTIRSALFLIAFVIIHALGNFADMIGGPDELIGEGYLFDRIHWTGGLGAWDLCPISIVEEYLALCFLLHIAVALKRSWDISINYTMSSGRWNMLISGLSILFFLTMHLQDFRFYQGYNIIKFRAPKYFIAFDGILEGHIFADPNGIIVQARDLYTREVALFKDFGTVLLYQVLITIFVCHMCMGWKKMVGADALQIPRDHQNRVKWLGWVAAIAVAGMYMSVPWYVYFTEPEKVVPAE